MKTREEILQVGLQIRRAEELLLEAFRDGHIRGTVHTCLGQELIPVMANEFFGDAFWFSNHRGHGHYLARTKDFAGLFAEILSREGGVSNGIGGSQHLLTGEFMSNGIQGGQAGIAAGFASSRNSNGNLSVMFIGDGTLGAGHLYESWNIAAIENARVLYVVEDNLVAQSTPSEKTFRGNLEMRVNGFGLNYISTQDDDLDLLESAFNEARNRVESQVPTVLHIRTKRLGPHSKGDDNRKISDIDALWDRDLIAMALKRNEIQESKEIIEGIEGIFQSVLERKTAKYVKPLQRKHFWETKSSEHPSKIINLSTHINESLLDVGNLYPDLFFLGEDISDDQYQSGAKYGGAFKVTSKLSARYPERVFSTPISESGFTGYGIGIALSGKPVIAEIMFGDFLTQNYDQIVHQMSKIPTMYGRNVPLPFILRTAVGGGRGYGPTHSAPMDNMLIGLPNIVVVSINQFSNYKEILIWAIELKAPTIILEPKALYAQAHMPWIYDEYQLQATESLGLHHVKPKTTKSQIAIVTHGYLSMAVLDSLKALAEKHEVFVEVIILEVISPSLPEFIVDVIERNGRRLVIVEESIGGAGAGTYLLSKLMASGVSPSLLHLYQDDWHPSGMLEEEVQYDSERIVSSVMNWMLSSEK
jgi:2-oxoisovalerate dehydrogenase E1 component